MSDQAKPVDHGFNIVVNATPFVVRDANVTYEDVVELAFPGGLENPDFIFRVEFEGAANKPEAGSLVSKGRTTVKRDGTEFSVIRSVRS